MLAKSGVSGFWGILAGFISWRSSKGKELSFPRMCELCDSMWGGNESRKEQLELEQSWEQLEMLGDSHTESPCGFWPD